MSECKKLFSLVARNTRCYFKDKFTFFMSLITPLILLVLFVTFLKNIYISNFESAIPEGITVGKRVINGVTGAWLLSSILGVSSVSVAFCSNTVMIDDKINSNLNDLRVSPVKSTTVSISYFISNFLVTLLIMITIMLIGHIYLAAVGWYIPVGDAFMLIVDCVCCVLFGTLLAGVFESFCKTQGAQSAMLTLVSSMYGFICGAYMPLSSFSKGLSNVLSLLPGTYSIGILRNHYMNGYLTEFANAGIPLEGITAIKDSFDGNLYSFGTQVPLWAMYLIVLGTCAVLLGAYIAIVILKSKKK